jgi:amylosucrase
MTQDGATAAEVEARTANWRDDIAAALTGLYPDRVDEVLEAVIELAADAARRRKAALAELDRQHERDADWYERPGRVGYAAYADRFGGDFAGVTERIGYLQELGVDVLHLMSVLKARRGESDGGYAIDDYRTPDSALGTVGDLEKLVDQLRAAGISVCLDLVMNHTSADHEWAEAARLGSTYHRNLYLTFPDRSVPDAYEATLPEVFPTMSPGSFTWVDELDSWVWTTFRDFQWDLNWANPDVLLEMVDILLNLANLGVEVIRLDAVAFTWKRLGTNCQNQPEAHLIAQALRGALGIGAPASILLAEAIVGPDDLIGYLGHHDRQRRECQLAYNNQLMVQSWSMLASGDVHLATTALRRIPDPPEETTWLTYVRCHDDIGWAVSDQDAAAAGLDGYAHRRFLAEWYRGDFPMSFARGAPFSSNPQTGDERTSGMAASLSGIAAGLEQGDAEQVDAGLARLLLLYAVAFGTGGIPMIYMGDEIALGDDHSYRADPARSADSRWLHRPAMDERQMVARHDPTTVPGRMWAGITGLVAARRRAGMLHGEGTTELVSHDHPAVLAWVRRHPRFGLLLGLANVANRETWAPAGLLDVLDELDPVDLLDPGAADLLHLPPYRVRWISSDGRYRTAPAVPR